jgi:Tfp pilus assembly protein PilP
MNKLSAMDNRFFLFLPILVTSMLAGCSSNQHLDQLKSMVNAPVPAVHPKSMIKKTPVYRPSIYRDANGENPFISFSEYRIMQEAKVAAQSTLPGGIPQAMATPLQRYALSSISVAGMLKTPKVWVILLTPNGKFYKASAGTPIGMKHGRILSIHDGTYKKFIVVSQYTQNSFGGFKKETITLNMNIKGN